MTMHSRTALRRVAAYLRARLAGLQGSARLASFQLALDPSSAELFRNYATPDDGADPDAAELAALRAAFERRRRSPRLAYIEALAPALMPRLLQAGFGVERALTLMSRADTGLVADGDLPGVTWHLAARPADLEEAARVQSVAYGVTATPPYDLDRLTRLVEQGAVVALARDARDGAALAAGVYERPLDGVAEIAAVGVRQDARGRGIGGAVTALLAEHAMVHDGVELPFLMTPGENEHRVYGRAGFCRIGELVAMSR